MKQKGMVFIAVLGLMMVTLSVGIAMMVVTRKENEMRSQQFDSLRAFYSAEAGVAHAIGEILYNYDEDGDGLGSLLPRDFNSDGRVDYSADYDPTLQTITVSSTLNRASRTIVIELQSDQWSGALEAMNEIKITPLVAASGLFNGDLDAKGRIFLYGTGQLVVNGETNELNTTLSIPVPSLVSYKSVADYVLTDCSTLWPAPPDGIYYITGNCVLDSLSGFTLNGSLIVEGNLSMNNFTADITITPTANNPAIIVGGNFLSNIVKNVSITGLIYCAGYVTMQGFDSFIVSPGAIVSGGNLYFLYFTGHFQVDFDNSLAPPYFTGGGSGGTTIKLWQGHKSGGSV